MASAMPAAHTPSSEPPISSTFTVDAPVGEAPGGRVGQVGGDDRAVEVGEPGPAVVVAAGHDEVAAGEAQRHRGEVVEVVLGHDVGREERRVELAHGERGGRVARAHLDELDALDGGPRARAAEHARRVARRATAA